MALKYLPNGNLVPGIHLLTWDEFIEIYGYTPRRRGLIEGLVLAMEHLSACGCTEIYIDGSFVSKERSPGDYDACWNDSSDSVDLEYLNLNHPLFVTCPPDVQKMKYGGQLYPAYAGANWEEMYIDFFQKDKYDKTPKGIVKLLIS